MGTRVYIGRVSYHAREKEVERFFRGFGRIKDIMLKNGYGFVEFEDYRDADDAVYELNGKELCGERVIVEHARGLPRSEENWRDRDRGSRFPPRRRGGRDKYGPPTRTEFRLIVENLSTRVSWQDLKDYMRQAGEVTYADAHKDRKNEGSAVTGIVEFASYSDMKNALDKLDDTEVNGRRIRLVEDRPRKRRRSSRSRSRSHSRSRSRSRRSRSRSRSRSGSHHSRSEQSRSRSRSRSRQSASRSPSKSRSKSQSRSRSNSPRSRSASRSKSKSRSPSPSRSKSQTPEPQENGSPADTTEVKDVQE